MTQPGRAAIEIVGDVSKFGRQLKKDVQDAVNNLNIDTGPLEREIGDAFTQIADDAGDAFTDIDTHFQRTSRSIRTDSENLAQALALDAQEIADAIGVSVNTAQRWIDGLQAPIERNRRALIRLGQTITDVVDDGSDGFQEIGRSLREAGENAQTFSQVARRGLASVADGLASLGSAAAGLVISGINPTTLITITAFASLIAAAIPLVIGLAAALADLAGLLTVLPGIVGALASSLIVGIVAFQGFGDAISAVIEGDPEKIAEALEKLAPAAQKVVREFQALLPLFRSVGDTIQQRFFEPLVGVVTQFGQLTLPRLRNELGELAEAMGRAFGRLGNLLSEAENVGILERLLASTARITDTLSGAIANLGQTFFRALDAGLPSLERLTDGLAGMIEQFSRFIDDSIASGEFQRFFEEALDTLAELKDLAGALVELFGVLFEGTDEEGRGFIGTLADLTRRTTEFFKSAEGQETLERMARTIELTGKALGVLGDVLQIVITGIEFLFPLWGLLTAEVSGAKQAFSDLGEDISSAWDTVSDTVTGAVESIIQWFRELPDRVTEFVQLIPERVATYFDMLVDNALTILAYGMAAIVVFFTDLPGQVLTALATLWLTITEWFTKTKDDSLATLGEIDAFFSGLPDRISEFLSSLPDRITAFFQRAHDGAVARLDALVEWAKGLPGRIVAAIGDAGRVLYDAGRRIIQGLISGISDKIGDLKSKIAEAVQQIRDHLPFSPAKIGPLAGAGSPELAGAKIAQMIAAGLESGVPLITGAANRSAGAVADAGLSPLATAIPGGGTPTMSPVQTTVDQQPVIIVMIGDEQIDAHIEKVVDQRVEIETRRLLAGSRGA